MVIIITGATHTGKTKLAQRMMEKYHYPYYSIDHLKMGLIRSGYTDLTPLDDEELTPYLWNVVKEIIKTAIENKQNLIVEGCYIPFDFRLSFSEEYLKDIRFLALVMTPEFLKNHFKEIISHEDDIETRITDTDLTLNVLIEENKKIMDGFRSQNEEIVLINDNYEEDIKKVI